MKNKIGIQLSVLVLLSVTLGCEETQDVQTPVTNTIPISERYQSAGIATLKDPSATLATISFTAKIKGHTGTVPSLLEYTGEAFLEGRLSFGFVMTSTCSGGSIYSTTSTTSCPITTGQVYNFNCPRAQIRGGAGAAMFACDSANIAGSSYRIYGELRSGVDLNSNYAIRFVRICGGPGVYPTC